MIVSAACIFLGVRYWWLPTNEVQLPVDFVSKAVKTPGTVSAHRQLMAIVNLRDVASLVPMDYCIDIELKMPKSTVNRQLGNFAIRGVLSNVPWSGDVAPDVVPSPSQEKTEKMCLFPFQSNIIRLIESLVFAPLYLFGLKDESSTVYVRLWDSAKKPLKERPFLLVSLDKPAWISAAKLLFTVRLRGIAYVLHEYPISTFILGTAFICEIELLSAALALLWYGMKGKLDASSPGETKKDTVTTPWTESHVAREPSGENSHKAQGRDGFVPAEYPLKEEDDDDLLLPEWLMKTDDGKETVGNARAQQRGANRSTADYSANAHTSRSARATVPGAAAAESIDPRAGATSSNQTDLPLSPEPSPVPSP